ncbi:MAG: hypothetical protein IPN71_00360 [Fibrobacteres bacterium]|nr:hypothetical protein [Fibrobacterota bacterium]
MDSIGTGRASDSIGCEPGSGDGAGGSFLQPTRQKADTIRGTSRIVGNVPRSWHDGEGAARRHRSDQSGECPSDPAQCERDTSIARLRNWLEIRHVSHIDFNEPEWTTVIPGPEWDDMDHLHSPESYALIAKRIAEHVPGP